MTTDFAVIVGDPHLAERTWANHRELTGDSMYSFWQMLEMAKHRSLPVILLGDIFDSKSVSSSVLQFFCGCMDDLQAHNIPVYYIQGNHDLVHPPWPAVHSWPIYVHGSMFVLQDPETGNKLNCYGLDWAPVANYARQLAEIPMGVDVLFTHQAWLEFGKMGSSITAECVMLPRSITVITGDLHIATACNGKAANGDPVQLISPGALCMQAINEPQQHFVYRLQKLDITSGVTVVPMALHTRKVYEFVCTTQADFDNSVAEIARLQAAAKQPQTPYNITAPIVRITYPMTISDDAYVRLQAAAERSGVHLFTNPQLEAVAVSELETEAVLAPTLLTLADAIAMLTAEPQEARALAAQLLNETGNIISFLTQFNADYMKAAVCELTPSS